MPPRPHYFTTVGQEEATSPESATIARLIDVFELSLAADEPGRDVYVGLDAQGRLEVCWGQSSRLGVEARQQLQDYELSTKRRRIAAQGLYLLDLRTVEHTQDPSSLNDPVYVHGTLLGPLQSGQPCARQQGRLVVTRGDLLQGFAQAQAWPFRYLAPGGRPSHFYHLALPGGREADTQQGRDLVVAYPLAPREVADGFFDNFAVLSVVVDEALSALRADLAELDDKRSLLAKAFLVGAAQRLPSPEEASAPAYFAVISTALGFLPAWPSLRANALAQRIVAGEALAAALGTSTATRSKKRKRKRQ